MQTTSTMSADRAARVAVAYMFRMRSAPWHWIWPKPPSDSLLPGRSFRARLVRRDRPRLFGTTRPPSRAPRRAVNFEVLAEAARRSRFAALFSASTVFAGVAGLVSLAGLASVSAVFGAASGVTLSAAFPDAPSAVPVAGEFVGDEPASGAGVVFVAAGLGDSFAAADSLAFEIAARSLTPGSAEIVGIGPPAGSAFCWRAACPECLSWATCGTVPSSVWPRR